MKQLFSKTLKALLYATFHIFTETFRNAADIKVGSFLQNTSE